MFETDFDKVKEIEKFVFKETLKENICSLQFFQCLFQCSAMFIIFSGFFFT